AFKYAWPADLLERLQSHPAQTLPMLLEYATPPVVALLGLGAIIGAVTSSFSSSILSAASMVSWNLCHRLLRPDLSTRQMKRLIRFSIVLLGAMSAVMALKVQSVQALWFFTSDLVFVLLFPQLLFALFDPKANRIGSITAFCVSLILRLGGGEPLFNLPPFIPYPEIFTSEPSKWYDGAAMLFPFKTLATVVGVALLAVVSRMTGRLDKPRSLRINDGVTEKTEQTDGF